MDATAFEEELLRFIRRLSGSSAPVASDTALLESGLIDSRRVVNLIEFIEQRLAITVPEELLSMEHFRTVRDIVRNFATPGVQS